MLLRYSPNINYEFTGILKEIFISIRYLPLESYSLSSE